MDKGVKLKFGKPANWNIVVGHCISILTNQNTVIGLCKIMPRPVFISASQNIVVGHCIFISTNQNIVGQCKIMCWPVYFFSQSDYCSN